MHIKFILSLFLLLIFAVPGFGAHPLITDDTGTQGRGKFQIEINAEHAGDSGNTATALGATLSAGLFDSLDLVIGVPYIFLREKDDAGGLVREEGMSDLSAALKWRFYEKAGFSLALKPGITLASGDEDKGLGDGKPTYSLFLITSRELEPFTLHLNLGYILNRTELYNIFHYSLAAEYAASKSIKIVGNVGGASKPESESKTHSLFVLGGLIYKVADNFDIDFGIKAGLNNVEADYTLLAGIAFRL